MSLCIEKRLERYIGIPYLDKGCAHHGCDCWGLVALIHSQELGNCIPLYHEDYATTDECREIDAIINGEKENPLWEAVSAPQLGDVLVFRVGRFESHVGLWISPAKMLHMAGTDCSKMEDFSQAKWVSRLTGIYRWRGQ
jgi:probable lipoprotein NlpC